MTITSGFRDTSINEMPILYHNRSKQLYLIKSQIKKSRRERIYWLTTPKVPITCKISAMEVLEMLQTFGFPFMR